MQLAKKSPKYAKREDGATHFSKAVPKDPP